jgi:hypothetical protein
MSGKRWPLVTNSQFQEESRSLFSFYSSSYGAERLILEYEERQRLVILGSV